MVNGQRIGLWLLVWGLLDLLCAMFCEIHADEAYYRLYGQFLDWGYFDHPPMVGLMTALSGAIVPTTSLILKNLSVRLVTVLMHVGTVYVIWKTIIDFRLQISDFRIFLCRFLLVAASIPMFCAYGFITTPDAPLLFFTALFFYAYRRLMANGEWRMTVLLGISMAGMMYSKYIAVLVIGFVVLGNIRLLREGKAWIALGLAALLMLPHLYWQYSSGFPSFTYHLVSRSTGYQALYTWEFIPNQLAVFNPIVWALGICAGLVIVARIVLMLNILPPQTGLSGKQAQMEEIHAQAQGLPVVFDGSFQAPSLYRYFYDDKAVLVRNMYDRYTQFDLWHLERTLLGKPACVRRKGQVYITDQLTEEDFSE